MKRVFLFLMLALCPIMETLAVFRYAKVYGTTDEVKVTGGTPDGNIPLTVKLNLGDGYKTYRVTQISYDAFQGNTTITRLGVECNEVLIGDGLYTCGSYNLQRIGDGTFHNCTNFAGFSSNIVDTTMIFRFSGNPFAGTKFFNQQSNGLCYLYKTLYAYKGVMPKHTVINIAEGTERIGTYLMSWTGTTANTVTGDFPMDSVSKIIVPASVKEIRSSAFVTEGYVLQNGSVVFTGKNHHLDTLQFRGLIPPQSYQYRNYEDRDIYSSSLSNTIVNYKSLGGEPLVVQVPCEGYDAYKASFGGEYAAERINLQGLPVNLELAKDLHGSIEATVPEGQCPCRQEVQLTAIPAPNYYFKQWSDGNTMNPRTVVISQDTIFRAEFSNEFKIALSVNDSLMGTVVGSGNYVYNTNVQIEALPTIGHKFVKWSDGNLDNPRNIIVTGDSVFSAEFSVDTFAVVLTVNDSLMGSVIGSGNYAYNTNAQIEAIPNSGYEFVKWNDNNVSNPRILTIVDDITIQAEFQESQTAIDYNMIIDGVYVRDKAIIIETTEIKNSISVYNSIGQCIYVSPKSGSNFKITVPQLGMYIVRVDAEVMKVVVK